jgi:hypothetical protein
MMTLLAMENNFQVSSEPDVKAFAPRPEALRQRVRPILAPLGINA